MSLHVLGIAAASIAALAWAALTFFMKFALENGSVPGATTRVNTLNAIFVTLIAAAALPLHTLVPADGNTLLLIAVAGIFHFGISRLFFYTALQRIGPNRCIPIVMSYPAVTALLATASLGEPLTLRIFTGLAFLLAGISMVMGSAPPQSTESKHPASWKMLGWFAAGLTSILWGLSAIFFKKASLSVHPLMVSTYALWVGAGTSWLIGLAIQPAKTDKNRPRHAWGWLTAAAVCQTIAIPFYNYAFTQTIAVRVTAIVSTQPVIVMTVSFLFLRHSENITLLLAAGVVLAVTGTLIVVT